jgi:hypothetical protein
MTTVYYKRLRMQGTVDALPEKGLALVHWDIGGSTRINVADLDEVKDDCYDENGRAYPRGRCDTCGSPCDEKEGTCTTNPEHEVALES